MLMSQPKLRAATPGYQGNLFGAPVDNTDPYAMQQMEARRAARVNPMMAGAGQPTVQAELPFSASSGGQLQRSYPVPAAVGGTSVSPTGMGYAPNQPQIGTPRYMGMAEEVPRTAIGYGGGAATAAPPSLMQRAAPYMHGAMKGLGALGLGAELFYTSPEDIQILNDAERARQAQPPAPQAAGGYRGQGYADPRMVQPAPQAAGGGFYDYSAGTAPQAASGYRGQGYADPRMVQPAPQAVRPPMQHRAPAYQSQHASMPIAYGPQAGANQQIGDDTRARAMMYLRDQGLLP